jgi:5-methyltetrahydrofolate--homocysteine methyltransferase
MKPELEALFDSILEGRKEDVPGQVQDALDTGIEPEVILNDSMIAAMTEVGRLFEGGGYFVPEMLISARAMQTGLSILKPRLKASGVEPVGKVVIGTVEGDLHDIGKNLVSIMFEGAGFEVTDLGVDVKPEVFIESVQRIQPQIVALSALLTTTMPNMKLSIDAMRDAGILRQVKVMVGGAPITTEFAQQLGADGFAPDASRAAALARTFVA